MEGSKIYDAKTGLCDGPGLQKALDKDASAVISTDGFKTLVPSHQSSEVPFKARFEAVRRATAVPPDPCPKPQAWGSQVAQVVGPSGEEVYTDDLGRVRVKFFWMRDEDHAEPGPEGPCTCWLRVAYPAAGSGIGFQSIPRVGDEVVVSFLEGNLDRPLITGVVHNGRNATPRFGGAGSLPANRTLTGLRTREHGGGLSSELLFDDTQGQVRARLATDHAASELNLGSLTTARSEGVADPRGEGFELRTDAWGAVRAGRGLLISTEAQGGAAGDVHDTKELEGRAESAHQLAKALGEASEHHEVGALDPGDAKALKGTIEGTEGQQRVFHGPVLALSSPGGILSGTDGSQVHTANADLHLSAGESLQFTAGDSATLAARESLKLFAAQKGLQIIAGKGDLHLHAHDGPLQVYSEQDMKIASANGEVSISAKDHLVLSAGGAQIEFKGGAMNITLPGKFLIKAAEVEWLGASSFAQEMELPKPKGLFDEQFVVKDEESGEPLAFHPYRIELPDGTVIRGRTDENGQTQRVNTGFKAQDLKLFLNDY